MYKELLPIDNTRFIDREFFSEDKLFHSVEVSDDRSRRNYVTFYSTWPSRDLLARLAELDRRHGVKLFEHNPDIYHRNGARSKCWLQAIFPDADVKSMKKHFHWNLKSVPTKADVEFVLDQIDFGLRKEFKEFILDNIQEE